jgi:sugar/nucleoside kinase (ribokinase family)
MQAVSGLLGPTPCLAVYSEADTADPAGLAGVIAAAGHWAVVTRGPRGVSWWAPGNHAERTQPAFPAVEVEPTGAGDCFAVACAMRARELALDGALDADVVQEAVAFGQAAAACSVEGTGPAELPTRAAVEERLAGREAA